MRKHVLAAAIVAFCLPAAGAELVVHGVSWHSDRTRSFDERRVNERNAGAGLRVDVAPAWSVQAGRYRNTHDLQSWYVLVDWMPARLGPLRIGAFAGAASNYVRWRQYEGCPAPEAPLPELAATCSGYTDDRRVLPAAGGLVRLPAAPLGGALRVIPGFIGGRKHGTLVALEVNIEL